jgi:diguanylate cyclase (GGDEF)-like protein
MRRENAGMTALCRKNGGTFMDLMLAQYVEINLMGTFLLFIMLFYLVRMHSSASGREQKFFISLLLCNAITLLADSGIYLMRGHTAPAFRAINGMLCAVYFVMHTVFGYLWIRYVMGRLYPEYVPGRRCQTVLLLPCVVSVTVLAANVKTGWIYTITDQNRYQRGPFIAATVLIALFYWGAGAVLALREIIRPNRMRESSLYATLLVFPIPTLLGNLFQIKFYGLSIGWLCSAVSLLILFIDWQYTQLSRDTLTGLYSRSQTNRQIAWQIQHLTDGGQLMFVIMIDVDHFKLINDRFGHLAGDQVLVAVAKILQRSCRDKDFIGRFGGDEFVVVGQAKEQQDIDELLKKICDAAAVCPIPDIAPERLTLSAGYSMYSWRDVISIDRVISAADREMYKIKAERKKRETGQTAAER